MLLTKIYLAHRASLELGEGQIVQSNLSSGPEIGSVPGEGGARGTMQMQIPALTSTYYLLNNRKTVNS